MAIRFRLQGRNETLLTSGTRRQPACDKRRHGARNVTVAARGFPTLPEEERFILLGLSASLRLLVLVHSLREGDVIRIISARKATRLETREYEIRLR